MAPEALPPNPVPSRAISNDISLLLASKSNRLRSSALFRNLSSSPASAPKKPSPHIDPAREDSAFTHGGQNSGVGFTPSSSSDRDKAGDAATATLRNKLLGKRKGRAGDVASGRGKAGQESEEDEDEGRSGLGRRKKVKKQRRDEEEETPRDAPKSEEQERSGEDGGEAVPRAASRGEDDTGAQPKRTTKAKKKKKSKARARNTE